MNASRAVRETDPLEPGQALCLIKYGTFYDLVANANAGRMHVVGEAMTFVRRQGSYLVVRDARGRAPQLWLAMPTLRINLSKATALTLRRAPGEPSPSR